MKKIYLALLTIIISFSLFSFKSYAETPFAFEKMVFFGDSLSDNGNLYLLTSGQIPKSPPYFKGRFSNGYLWTDNLANRYQTKKMAFNLAVAGLTVTRPSPAGQAPTLADTLNDFLKRFTQIEKSNTLYLIWAGANDYLSAPRNIDEITTKVNTGINQVIETLISQGADNFLIINLPDLSKIPQTLPLNGNELFHNLVLLHNIKLHESINQMALKYPHIKIQLFNVYQLFNQLLEKTEEMNREFKTHITNTKEACLQGAVSHENLKDIRKNQSDEFKICANPDDYVFWDSIHPSKIAHFILSVKVIDFIEQHYRSNQSKA